MAPPHEGYQPKYHDIYAGISPEKYTGINKGKVALITGASKGLGLASAHAFAQSGADLFIAARSTGALAEAKKDIESKYGVRVEYGTVDVSKQESVKAGVQAVVEKFGRIDIVISNAGGGEGSEGPVADVDAKAWWDSIELNVKGAFTVANYAVSELEKTKGHIVFLSSILAQTRLPNGSAYNISKHAINRLAEWIDIDHGSKGVKAYAIHPGAVPTDLSAKLLETNPAMRAIFIDTPQLSAWSEVRITSGSEDWLSGRFYDCTWGFDTMDNLKDKILDADALKNRLAIV